MTGLYKVKYIMDRVKLYINFTIKEGLQKKEAVFIRKDCNVYIYTYHVWSIILVRSYIPVLRLN